MESAPSIHRDLPDTASPLVETLAAAAAQFEIAAAGGASAVSAAVAGIRILAYAPTLSRGHPAPAEAAAIVAAIRAALDPVCAAVGEAIADEQVYLGLAAAENLAALFGRTPDELAAETPMSLAADFLDEAMLLGALLDADFRRRAIAERGNPFRRMIVIRRALAETGDGRAPH